MKRLLPLLFSFLFLSTCSVPVFAFDYFNGPAFTMESPLNECASTGAVTNTYACTLSPAISAYHTGTCYTFIADSTNTGSATINFNSLGAKTIKTGAGGARRNLVSKDILNGQAISVCYDGTNMQMINPSSNT